MMTTSQTVTTQKGLKLEAEIRRQGTNLELVLKAPSSPDLTLHWGLRRSHTQSWTAPPEGGWPSGTTAASQGALQTPFRRSNGQSSLSIQLNPAEDYASLEFVLFFPEEGRWDNNGGRNYTIALAEPRPPAPKPSDFLQSLVGTEELVQQRVFDLGAGMQLAASVSKSADGVRVRLVSNAPEGVVLHWGIAQRSPQEWLLPPESCRGAGSVLYGGQAVETPFSRREQLSFLQLEFSEGDAPLGMQFVLRTSPQGKWINNRGGNFFLPVEVRRSEHASSDSTQHPEVVEEIIRAETTHNSWTLMHRFNLCYELLERVQGSLDGLALIFVYLRFSSIRQLTWQRNYNTKPRELAHAQDRLTARLADIFLHQPASRTLARLALTTVGRGGEGQRIRDEILNIMHRHHIKEVSGHFLEEWHQKLHNNTTPDDIVICEAYLNFLRDNGSHDSFYRTLEAGGVTRQRLESFERPIRSRPDFVPHLKDALLGEFWHFLKILKASHSGTDLETALNAARGQLDGGMQGLLGSIWENRNASTDRLCDLVRQITDARRGLSQAFGHSGGLRELLYLDLALEQLLRAAVERNIHLSLQGDQLVDLISWVLENLALSNDEPELGACSRHWQRLQSLPRFGAVWALHAKSVADRAARALGGFIDRFYHLLQPKAELLGEGFHAEPWTITLFSEEVVRGSSLGFVLSMLLRHLDPLLRQAANMGSWQIISRGQGHGQVELVDALRSIQGKRFESPRIVIADQVAGEEEIPESVTAVIVPDVVDIVSHVAVRARNAHVLFASCHDPELLDKFKALRGRAVRLDLAPSGDILATEIEMETPKGVASPVPPRGRGSKAKADKDAGSPGRSFRSTPKSFTSYAIPFADFDEQLVGSKAYHQVQLRRSLPEWIHQPASAAIPFAVFEQVLGLASNRDLAKRYADLARQARTEGAEGLAGMREAVLALNAPPELESALRKAMDQSGLAWPGDWKTMWDRIKQVWASKWNERAYLSRERVGLPHEALFMAVLIQQVVPADYAYVIHTSNPSSGNRDELFAEVVLGLGETLVGNYPGRALSFVYHKKSNELSLLSFPGKSIGLYGEGLIFRSDSNGEDLPGYAGAGLYDSVLLHPPREAALDYTNERLVWDEKFRADLLRTIARVGMEVERICGSPQDVEGAVTGADYYVVQTRPQVGLNR